MKLAVKNGLLYTITHGIIAGGTVLMEDGKIVAVGTDVAIPEDSQVIDAAGQAVTPGLIDAHAHIGLFGEPSVPATADGNEKTGPVQSSLFGIDSLNPADPAFPQVLAAGVTTVYTGPGSSNIIGGTGMVIKTTGRTVGEMVIPGSEGMKMALGENPKRNYRAMNRIPATRMGNAAVLRQALVDAQNYQQKLDRAKEEGKPHSVDRNLGLEQLCKVLRREMKARIHCHRADDIITAIRIAEEFNLDFVLEHATEGYKVADILAAKQVPCVVGPLLMGPSKHELWEVRLDTPAVLAKAGVKVAIQMDTSSGTKWLPMVTGLAVRAGMEEEAALRAITINPAEILGLADRLGSIEVGKDADLAIFDGHPLCNFTTCQTVIVGGQVKYQHGQS
ncbi:MAG: amidohydrolase [Bacillota bacterium]|jgi:imidazolonepropionase-like amidohydrolase